MTKIYFVRHAQPEYAWEDDQTRPLTEEGGESIAMVQKRNMEALKKILAEHPGKEIVIGTHGLPAKNKECPFGPAGCLFVLGIV